MSLLFDQNLSHRLVRLLAGIFPGSIHVRDAGLREADDESVWTYAASHGLAIVSKDADFRQRSFLRAAPPKIIWVRLGNCTTSQIEALLRLRQAEIRSFLADAAASLLILS